jgi:hypothetical protein
MGLSGNFSVSAAVRGPHPNNSLLFRVYPARQRIPGPVPRKWLKTWQKPRPGWE